MTLESETLFVVGESDELVCNSPTQSFVISGLKNARVGGWRVSMTNETLAIFELVINDVEKFAVTPLFEGIGQFWIKFEEDKFLDLRKLESVDVNADTHNKLISIFLEFKCLPVTFEQAVAAALSQSVPEKPRKSFTAYRNQRNIKPDPNTVVGPVEAFSPSSTYPPQTHIAGPDGTLYSVSPVHSVSPVDLTTMGWKDVNHVVEFPKVKITKHEE